MSKYVILCENAKKLAKLITNKEKFTVSDVIFDDSCDVIFVAKNASVTEADLDMIANMLEARKVIVGTSQKKSGFKKFVYRFFGASHGENCTGIVGIPKEFLSALEITSDMRAIRIIKNAETKKLPIIELPLPKSEIRGAFNSFVGDLFSLFLVSGPLKFIFSSCVAFLLDITVFSLLDKYLKIELWKLEICQITAWCFSSLTNFFINRYFVFKTGTKFWPSFAEYYGLAGIVFVLKTLILELFTKIFFIYPTISKIIAEVTFFTINYFVQKLFIFKKKSNKADSENESGPEENK